jgi:GNAT superfamily N-acetyltransferase
MQITVEQIHGRAQLREFIELPRRLYRGMAGYVAPLDAERRELIDPKKSPFFSHGQAAYWIAYRDGRAAGRISAQIDDVTGPNTPANLGLFGCLDAIDDGNVVTQLLHTAEGWLRERGRRLVRGPFILSINGESGMLIEGQLQAPMILMPWHPDYLHRHVANAGYRCATRLFSFELDLAKIAESEFAEADVSASPNFTMRNMRLADFTNEMEIARSIYNDGWRRNWGFVPGTKADAAGLARSFKPLLIQEAAIFACSKNEPVGFALTLPNFFDVTADIGASPGIFGWLKLAWRMQRRRYRSFRLVFIGGREAYHGTGIGRFLLAETIRRIKRYGGEKLTCAWVLESNAAFIHSLRQFRFSTNATYVVFEKEILP